VGEIPFHILLRIKQTLSAFIKGGSSMGYTKHETIKKQRKIVSKSQRMKRKVLVNIFKFLLVGIITVIIAVAGAGFGMIKGILDNARI